MIYYGKPHLPIYDRGAGGGAGQAQPRRPLAVGDGLLTDIKGANRAGLEALFIADGVHGEEIGPILPTIWRPCSPGSGSMRQRRHARAQMVRR